MRRTLRMPLLLAMAVAVAAAACDKVQLLAPSSSTITVSASTRTLPIGGTTEITAFVAEQAGTPVQNGTTVRFSTNLGTVDPVEAQTRNGIATTTFSAGNSSGVAQIRAASGNAGASTGTGNGGTATSTNMVEIQVGAAAATAVLVTASPSSVPPTGATITVIASATDTNGNRITGVPVSFSTTSGTLSSTTAVTDENGEARVQLTANQAATVTARVGNQTATAAVTQATATSVTLATTPNPSAAGNPVALTVTPAAGTVPTVTINWGDGSSTALGTVAAARGVTHIYGSPGIYTITADATGQSGDSFSTATTQTVTSRPGPTITASATTGTTATTFVFTVTPATGTSPSNVVVDFGDGSSTELGAITMATTVTKRYTSTGSFTVRATQTEPAGSSSSVVVVTVSTS